MSRAGVAVGVVSAALGVPADVVRAWARMGAPLARPGRPYLFKSVDAVRSWYESGSHAAEGPLFVASRVIGRRSYSLPWAGFRREGWASLPCDRHKAREPLEATPRFKAIGDHVIARVERESLKKGPLVTVRCWCSARIAVVPLQMLPAAQRSLIPAGEPTEAS